MNMEPARPTFWNVPHWAEIAQYVLGGLVVLIFLVGLYLRVRRWRLGRPEPGTEKLSARLVNLVRFGVFQWRLASDPFAAIMHLAIFWGMVVLAIGTALATIDWDVTRLFFGFQFLTDGLYYLFELVLDLFGVLLIVGLAMAAWRRYVLRPQRLRTTAAPRDKWESAYLLAILLLIAVSGFLIEGVRLEAAFRAKTRIGQGLMVGDAERLVARSVPAAAWAPVGLAVSKLFTPLSSEGLRSWHQAVWWVHALAAFVFIGSVPFTKAFHLISSPVNIFFANPSAGDKLTPAGPSGVQKLSDFTWRQLLQIDACTSCGRCQDACPGYATGLPLSPRNLVQTLYVQLSWTAAGKANGNGRLQNLHDGVLTAEELWACCTCRACEEVCPALIEQPRLIVDLRRHLVDQGRVDEGLQQALTNLNRYGNSFGQSPRKRATWTCEVGFPVKNATKEQVEYLWFVGDYASYDPRGQRVTQISAALFQKAGLDFGLLFDKEQNAGNDVRRAGEEGLFEMLAEQNMKLLAGAQFQRIVTTDPHTYHTLKNEYPKFGLDKPVVHYTELLDELMRQGRLGVRKPLGWRATYHDPCYLGRYNGVYDPPRRLLAALGVTLVEMPRHRADSFCCGAGGGRIWMKDVPGIRERPAENRIREALALPGVEYFVVACPKDLAMFQDAVKTVRAEDRLKVVDLGELVWQSVIGGNSCEAKP